MTETPTVWGYLPYQLVGQIFEPSIVAPCNQGCSEVKRPNSSDTGTGEAPHHYFQFSSGFLRSNFCFFSHQEARWVPCRSRTRSAFLNLCRWPDWNDDLCCLRKGLITVAFWLGGFELNPAQKHAVQPGKVNWLTWKLKTADFQFQASFWNQLPRGCMLVFSGGLHILCNTTFSYLSFLMNKYTFIS